MKRIVSILISVIAFWATAIAQEGIFIPTDWISLSGDVYISGRGEVVEVPFGYYSGGVSADVLVEQIELAIADAALEDVITDVSVDYTMPLLEGSIYLTFAINLSEDERQVEVSASSGDATIIQPLAESAVYNLTGGTSPIWHGQEFTLRISSSDTFAFYCIKRISGGITTYGPSQQGTGSQLQFKDSRDGTYKAVSNFPVEVAMNGTVNISYLPFYGLTHSFTTASYTVSPDGEKITVPFTPSSSANMTQLATIIAAYNGGQSLEWDDRMQLSYANNTLTLLAAPNLGNTAIANNTWFKNGSSATLTFSQQGGGSLLQQAVTFSGGGMTMTLAGTQPLVTYSLISSNGIAIASVTGTGEPATFTIPANAPAGTYTIVASYRDESLAMDGGVVITPSGAMVNKDNFILKETALNSAGSSVTNDITYYDGLGYPEQVISVAGSPDGSNIVTPIWYDAARRDDARTYLPYASGGNTLTKEAAAFTAQQAWYTARYGASDGQLAYAQKTYEQSSLNRPLAARKAGSAYSASGPAGVKETTTAYASNATGEVLLIKYSVTNGVSTITSSGYYNANKLNKTDTTNEDGQATTTFTAYDGKTVLSRTLLGNSTYADTYYVYDGAGRTVWVISPEGSALLAAAVSSSGSVTWASTGDNAKAYAYLYAYDGLGRMTEKRLPGMDAIYMVYDPAGRVVAQQDGVQRASNKWILTRYNNFGEETERYLSAAFTRDYLVSAFAATAYPTAIYGAAGNTLLLQRQYGGTRPQSAPAFSAVTGVVTADSLSSSNAGRVVWEKVYDQDNPSVYAERSFFYDARGRLRQSVERDPLQNTLRTSVLPDYAGNALKTVTSYTVGQTSYVAETVNTYDDRGRVLTSTTTAQGASAKTTYAYDALGRVKGADYGPALGTAILSVRDSVNIQGFRTESTASLAGGGNVYSQTLRYFNPQKGTTARFSGAVSEWQQNQGTDSDTYGFAYDAAGRLTAGTRYAGSSTTGSASFTERGISYDKAGGMLAIQRYGSNASTPEDNLTLTYNGMTLASVTGTIGGQTVGATFTYDACGRTLTDGVSKLNYQYNLLGALTSVADAGTLTPTTLSTYRHLADGTKYMTVSAGNNGALLYRGPLTFTIADVTATTPAISFLRAETGSTGAAIIASATGSGATPYFYVTDQLGSVRAVVDSQGSVVERNDYYTYGKRHTTGRTYADLKNSPLLFSGKEDQGQALDLASGTTTPSDLRILDFGARHYDPIVPRWTTPDPLAEKYFPINTYAYCAGDPVNLVDPEGFSPIYNAQGHLLGTDDQGLQGGAIFMAESDFQQGMSHADAIKQDQKDSFLEDESAISRFKNSYYNLSKRPDWDGYLSLSEAIYWYRNGNGQPLYVSSEKIDLSQISLEDIKNSGGIVQLLVPSVIARNSLKFPESGEVYGQIQITIEDENTGKVLLGRRSDRRLDTYDFRMHKWNSLKNIGRNILTLLGKLVVGSGKEYDIYTYGYGHVARKK